MSVPLARAGVPPRDELARPDMGVRLDMHRRAFRFGPGAKVVILTESALSERDFRRYGVGDVLARGCDVTVLDVSALVYPDVVQSAAPVARHERLTCRVIASAAAWTFEFDTLRRADIVFSMVGSTFVSASNLPVLRLLGRSGAPSLTISCNAQPHWSLSRRGFGLHDWLGRLRRMRPVDSIVSRMPPGLLGVSRCDFIVYGGRRSRTPNVFVGPETVAVEAHAMDYDVMREALARARPKPRTAVFIDEYLPYHRDWAAQGIGPAMAAEPYRIRINALFDRIEAELGLRVVVAVCPRADYGDKPNFYGRREMIFGDTARAVAECELAIAHGSTAINYAVMRHKPVMLALTRDIYGHLPAHRMLYDALARELATPLRWFDDPQATDLSNAFAVDSAAYARFMADYVKSPVAADRPFWDIVTDAIERHGLPARRS